jgi:hypothetical protein
MFCSISTTEVGWLLNFCVLAGMARLLLVQLDALHVRLIAHAYILPILNFEF